MDTDLEQLREEVRRLEARHVSLSDQFLMHVQQRDHKRTVPREPAWWQTAGPGERMMAVVIALSIVGMVVELLKMTLETRGAHHGT